MMGKYVEKRRDPEKVDWWEQRESVCVKEKEIFKGEGKSNSSNSSSNKIGHTEFLQHYEQFQSLIWHVGEIHGPRSSLLLN